MATVDITNETFAETIQNNDIVLATTLDNCPHATPPPLPPIKA